MDTLLILFSLDPTENLRERYESLINLISSFGSEYLEFTKTAWFVRTKLNKNTVRDQLLKEMKRTGSDGRVMVLEVGLTGWSMHVHDRGDENIGDWIKRFVSGD